jgi:hypothetical protein
MCRSASLALLGGAIRAIALAVATALTLTGCLAEPDGYRYAVPAGAGGNYAPAQPNYVPQPNYPPPARNSRDLPSQPGGYAQPQQIQQPPQVNPMIDDPEAPTTTWPETVTTSSESVARKECQRLADLYTQSGGTRVIVKSVVPNRSGKSFTCTFEGEN